MESVPSFSCIRGLTHDWAGPRKSSKSASLTAPLNAILLLFLEDIADAIF